MILRFSQLYDSSDSPPIIPKVVFCLNIASNYLTNPPDESQLEPFLTTVASLLGTSTCIEINKKWKEPALLWFVTASKKGTNKLIQWWKMVS